MKVIFHFRDSQYTVKITDTKNIIDLKNIMIESINDNTIKYIDLNFICENPIRSFGQHTINSGIFSRTWDNMTLDHYPLESKNLRIEIIPVDKYSITENIQQKTKAKGKGKGIGRFKFGRKNEIKSEPKKIAFDYDLDFPPLGS